ncbi:hypothetical protein FHS15_000920 [Paenibacillus castaneae]|uniref:hypothetical protein n=1 Tax=Paenibacillus castaneae TaxID=474957 RepID=UPI000C9A1434|nr:hypothetical protein [Paenibacillus castaneae]NIK75820.1 hypothetical protein [Paenibacillus castaneae]
MSEIFNKKAILLVMIGIVLIIGISIQEKIIVSNKNAIHMNDEYVVVGPHFNITKERYDLYKANMELSFQLSKRTSINVTYIDDASPRTMPSDSELLDVLITKELAIADAKSKGIMVLDSEVSEVIDNEREIFASIEKDGGNNDVIMDLMHKRIQSSGMSEDEFWSSDSMKKSYADSMYINKLFKYLVENNQFENNDKDFEAYQKELLIKNKKKLIINL